MRIRDWSSDVCSSDLPKPFPWAIATARGRQREGANPIATGPPGSKPAPSRRLAAIHALLDGVSDATQPELAERRDSPGLEPPGLPVPRLGSGGCPRRRHRPGVSTEERREGQEGVST